MHKSGVAFALLKEDRCLSRQLRGPGAVIDLSYSFANGFMNFLEKEGLIALTSVGREKKISLTPKGKEAQSHLVGVMKILSMGGENV